MLVLVDRSEMRAWSIARWGDPAAAAAVAAVVRGVSERGPHSGTGRM